MDKMDIPHNENATEIAYTHGHADAVLRSHRWRTAENSAAYLLPHLHAGMSLLDVGCGPGTLTCDLAGRVAPGVAVAVDLEPNVVDEAVRVAKEKGVAVDFHAGDFAFLERPVNGYDVIHAHQVLQHVVDPVGVLRNMARLASPGGIVAARDADYPGMTWWPRLALMDRWLDVYLQVTARNNANADGGRQLLHWAREAGLEDVAYTTSTWTYCTPEDLAWWSDLWADRVTASRFGEQAIAYGIATEEELAAIATAWRAWAKKPGAVFVVLHGEIIARVPGRNAG